VARTAGLRGEERAAFKSNASKSPVATDQQRYLPVAPMMAMPVMPTPAPVTVTPTPMAMVPAPVMAMSPPHLLRLEPFDLLTRCHGWIGILTRFIFN
jgi:hypothetical protein